MFSCAAQLKRLAQLEACVIALPFLRSSSAVADDRGWSLRYIIGKIDVCIEADADVRRDQQAPIDSKNTHMKQSPSSFLFLVGRPGATSSVLAPGSDALATSSFLLQFFVSCFVSDCCSQST